MCLFIPPCENVYFIINGTINFGFNWTWAFNNLLKIRRGSAEVVGDAISFFSARQKKRSLVCKNKNASISFRIQNIDGNEWYCCFSRWDWCFYLPTCRAPLPPPPRLITSVVSGFHLFSTAPTCFHLFSQMTSPSPPPPPSSSSPHTYYQTYYCAERVYFRCTLWPPEDLLQRPLLVHLWVAVQRETVDIRGLSQVRLKEWAEANGAS